MTDNLKDVRDYLFRGVMFEYDASHFREAGIQVGSSDTADAESLLNEVLAPFSIVRRNQALEMSRLYAVLFCFENDVRQLIRDTLSEADGPDWWDGLANSVKTAAEGRKATALKDSWLEGDKTDLLGFADFNRLSDIIVAKWEQFESIIPSQHWLQQRLTELEKARNFVAHNRMLLPSEFQRVYMYIADWNRVVGL